MCSARCALSDACGAIALHFSAGSDSLVRAEKADGCGSVVISYVSYINGGVRFYMGSLSSAVGLRRAVQDDYTLLKQGVAIGSLLSSPLFSPLLSCYPPLLSGALDPYPRPVWTRGQANHSTRPSIA